MNFGEKRLTLIRYVMKLVVQTHDVVVGKSYTT